MNRLGKFIVKYRWWVLAIWLVAAVVIVGLSPKLSSVENNNESNFLPKNSESYQALNIAKKISPYSQNAADTIVFENTADSPLSSVSQQTIKQVVSAVTAEHLSHVLMVSTSAQQLSPNGKVQLGVVIYSGEQNNTATLDAVNSVRNALSQHTKGTGVTANITGIYIS
jgi:RND superfamily putative drug exporter